MDLPTLSSEVRAALVAEAHQSSLVVLAHAFSHEDTLQVLSSGVDGTAHTILDQPPTDELVEAFRVKDAFCTPTLTVIGSSTTEGREMQEKYARDPRVQDLLAEGGREKMCECLSFTKVDGGSLRNATDTIRSLKMAGVDILWYELLQIS